MLLESIGREEAEVNDSPVGCQSRLTEAASSRKKEPYRPHQAKPELVARLEVTSNGVIFLCIRNFAQIPITGARCAPACMPSVTAAPCQTFGVPLACLPHSGRQAPRPQRGNFFGAFSVWAISRGHVIGIETNIPDILIFGAF